MFPQTSADEMRNVQKLDDKLQPLIQYLKDETSPKDAPTANKNQKQERTYFLSESNISCMQANTGKKTVIQLVVPKALQMELLQWCQDHFTSGHLGLNKAWKKPEVNIFLERNVC